MADLIQFNPVRATDGNNAPSPGALAYFYLSNTTTPATVYSDNGLSVPHATPLVADGNGVFPRVLYSGGQIKAVVKTADGVELYTLDPVPVSRALSSAASEISFDPSVAIPETNVQDAIDSVADSLDDYEARVLTAGTLLSGGGDLSADRTFDVQVATQAEAEAGTISTRAMTPQRAKQQFNFYALGFGQTRQYVGGSRAVATPYQNTTNRPISVSVTIAAGAVQTFQTSADGVSWNNVARFPTAADVTVTQIIMPGEYYQVTGGTIVYWSEIR